MLPEQSARRVLFFHALYETDASFIEEEDFAAGAQNFPPGEMDEAAKSAHLSRRLEERLERRYGLTFARYYHLPDLPAWVKWGLWALCFLLALGSNYLGGKNQVNLLLNPVSIFLLWNFAVYLFLAVLAGPWKPKPSGELGLPRLWPRLSGTSKRASGVESGSRDALLWKAHLRFLGFWSKYASRLTAQRIRGFVHLCAACFALGLIAGLYARGLIQHYRFEWSSTFISDIETMKRLLAVIFGPALLLRGQGFSEGLPPLEGSNGAPWIHLLAWSTLVYVLIPRLCLATWALLRARREAHRRSLPMDRAFYLKLLAPLQTESYALRLVAYSYTPQTPLLDSLRRAAHGIWGERAAPSPLERVEWGETEWSCSSAEKPRPTTVILCFNGVQTPETEVHGAFAESFSRQTQGPEFRAAVVVDAQEVPADSLHSRRETWRAVLAAAGWDRFLWLEAGHDFDSVLSGLINGVRSSR